MWIGKVKFNADDYCLARDQTTAGAHAFGELANKVGDCRHRRARRLVAGSEAFAHRIDQRRADHDAVGVFRDSASLFRRAHAEANTDRKFGMPLDARNGAGHRSRVRRGGAGYAGDRNVIDEARRVGEHHRQPLVVGGRRGEADEIDAGLERRQAKLGVLFRRQVDDDQPIDAGGLGIGEKFLDAVDVDWIVVAHQHDRRRVVAGAEVAHDGKRLLHVGAGMKRAQACGLDRGTIGHWVRERHAELDHVGAGLRQRLEDCERRGFVGIARHGEGYKRGAAIFAQRGKAPIHPFGHRALLPRCRATESKSLSPRPERLTTIR